MNTTIVSTNIANNVATITLGRPEVKNALNNDMHRALYDAFTQAKDDDNVRAIVLTGSGDAFCAGADLKSIDLSKFEEFDYGEALRETYNRLITLITSIDKPIIAAINGIAIGAGLSIALACDYRVASEKATFGLGFLNIGLVPDAGASYFLPKLIGYANALEMPLKGIFGAEEAKRIGLIHDIGDVTPWVEKVKQLPPTAFGLMKRNLREGSDSYLQEVLEMEVSAQVEASQAPEHRAALAHFVGKGVR
ncbi:enoyl-CoA hydratase-related protein [Bacillus sp. FSL W7-1360]